MFSFNVTDPFVGDKIDNFALPAVEALNPTSGFDDMHVYVSYADGIEGLDPIYGAEKLLQLPNLKQKWDPKGVFRYNNALPNYVS